MLKHGVSALAIRVGYMLPEFRQTFTEVDLMAYGAATWDWHRNHYDQHRVEQLDFEHPFVDGQNFGSIFARELMHWAGPAGFIRRMGLRFHTMVYAGDTLIGGGNVTEIHRENDHLILQIAQHLHKDETIAATCATELRPTA
jgi:acyl dehydratase